MKKALFLLVLAAIGCSPKPKETPVMSGAYTMLSQTLTSPTATDSAEAASSQLKIYTPDFVMWARVVTADSVASFGVGSYVTEPGALTETLIYSASDTVDSDDANSFKLEIEKTEKGFNQAIKDMEAQGKKYTLKESYESVGTGATSPLDGIWKLTRRYNVSGKDTTDAVGTEYKAYASGYVMFGFTYVDSLKTLRTGMGYGKFEMTAPDKVKETMTASNFYWGRGQNFDVSIELMGADAFRQSITGTGGTGVEEYQRLKR